MGQIINRVTGEVVGNIGGNEVLGKPFLCVYGSRKPRNCPEDIIERPLADGLTAYIRFETSEALNKVINDGDKNASNVQGTIIGRKPMLDLLGLTEDELFEQADKNTVADVPTLDAVLKKMSGLVSAEPLPIQMHVAYTTRGIYGAGVIAKPMFLDLLYAGLGSFYVLPSSIHEVIITPRVSGETDKQMNEMVDAVNKTVLEPNDVLADTAFYFDSEGLHKA